MSKRREFSPTSGLALGWGCPVQSLFVKLAHFMELQDAPSESATWFGLREFQSMALELPSASQGITSDIGEAARIHPHDELDVGDRLAIAARHVGFGEDLLFSGPSHAEMTVQGAPVRLCFDHVGGGCFARGAVAGEGRRLVRTDDRSGVTTPRFP